MQNVRSVSHAFAPDLPTTDDRPTSRVFSRTSHLSRLIQSKPAIRDATMRSIKQGGQWSALSQLNPRVESPFSSFNNTRDCIFDYSRPRMPKRRLYNETADENDGSTSASSSRGRSTQRSSSHRKSSDVLLSLADACTRHSEYHQSRNDSSAVAEDEGDIPEKCCAVLERLRQLLPRVEKSFQPPPPGKKGPDASDIAHLCNFYDSALQGVYCPHASHLFQRGKDPKEGT